MKAQVTASTRPDDLKAEGRYFEAGQQQFRLGGDRVYGCHFGMRSTRERDMTEYFAGYDAESAK